MIDDGLLVGLRHGRYGENHIIGYQRIFALGKTTRTQHAHRRYAHCVVAGLVKTIDRVYRKQDMHRVTRFQLGCHCIIRRVWMTARRIRQPVENPVRRRHGNFVNWRCGLSGSRVHEVAGLIRGELQVQDNRFADAVRVLGIFQGELRARSARLSEGQACDQEEGHEDGRYFTELHSAP